jgi:hypothetical protein
MQVEEADRPETKNRPETKKMPNTSESRHQAELLLGDGPPKPGTEKTDGGAHRRDSQPIASGLTRRGWNSNEQGEEGRGCAIAIYRREGFRRTSPSRARGSFTFSREPAPATPPTRGRRRNRPVCAERSRAPGKRTLAVFPGSQAETPFLAYRSRAPSRARCANKAACSPGAQPGCWAGVANTP